MWKANWQDTKKHFVDWWNREGLVIGTWGCPRPPANMTPHEIVAPPPEPKSIYDGYADGESRAMRSHAYLARHAFPCDVLPLSFTDIGPGSLALFCGCKPGFSKETVWFEPCIKDVLEPESLPSVKFDASCEWWKITETTMNACARLGRGKYIVGCPDLVENMDILASMRDAQTLLMDLIERSEWVEKKIEEINQVWFEAYQRIYDIIKLEDGSSAYGAFCIWGPGKTAKVQCDASAMFSPDMFRQFVVPSLTRQCEWLDNSMYHLDGTQAVCHLDALLEIEPLDAIEWTPQSGIETAGDQRWFDMYRKILRAGKSIQVVGIKTAEVLPLLDAIGHKGVYMLGEFSSTAEVEAVRSAVDKHLGR
jgi:hypothetical protein